MKRKILALLLIMALLITCSFAMTACGEREEPVGGTDDPVGGTDDPLDTEELTVTFYDGSEVLETESVEDGAKIAKPAVDPTKEGKVFVGWFATPSMSRDFDFDVAITADTSVFAGFSTYEEDTRNYSIVGSGTSTLMLKSKWGTVFTDDMKLVKAKDKNEYTITVDLLEGDQFQFALTGVTDAWLNQRGFGYLETTKLPNGDIAFSGAGGLGDTSSKRMNITVVVSGNYTFTMSTYPADDIYDTENAEYTEAGKENYNIGTFDRISFVRNGDATAVEAVTNYYIKGAGITEWKSMYNDNKLLSPSADNEKVVEGTFYLKAGEEFMFISQVTVGELSSDGTEYAYYQNLDDASKALFELVGKGNIKAKAAGNYTFSYNTETKALSAKLAEGSLEVADYYIDGTFVAENEDWEDYCFKPEYKLVLNEETGLYEINDVVMEDGEFIIQMFKVGATERGKWGTESYTGLGSRNYTHVAGDAYLTSAVGGEWNSKNIAIHEGTYSITYNPYSNIINIVNEDIVVGMKGTMNEWNPLAEGYGFEKKADGSLELIVTLAVDDEFGLSINPDGVNAWVGRDQLVGGDAKALFGESGNLKATVAGEYKLVYNSAAGTFTIDSVVAE